jgi:hypothetical protein
LKTQKSQIFDLKNCGQLQQSEQLAPERVNNFIYFKSKYRLPPRPPTQKKPYARFDWKCLFRHSIGTVQMQEEFHIDFSPCICLGREMSDLLNNDESFVPTEKLF